MEFLFKNINPVQIFFKNSFWLSLGQIVAKIFKFLLVIYAARILGPNSWGSFQYVLSVASFFFLFSSFGMDYLIIRDWQQKKDYLTNYLSTVIILRLVLIIISVLVAFTANFLFENKIFKAVFLIAILFLALDNFRDFLNSFLKAKQEGEKEFFTIFSEQFVVLISGIILLQLKPDIAFLAIAYLIGALISCCLALKLSLQGFTIIKKFKLNLKIALDYIKQGMPLTLYGLLGTIFFSSDQILLGKLKSTEEVGYYSIAAKIISFLISFYGIFLVVVLPYLAKKILDYDFKRVLKKITLGFLALSFLGFIIGIISSFLVPFVFGFQYLKSVKILQVLSLLILFLPLTMLFDNILFLLNKIWQNFFITSFVALLNIILNFILIPYLGVYGAAWATIISQIINLIVTAILLLNCLKNFDKIKNRSLLIN